MSFSNIELRSLEIYHPSKKLDNEFFIKHFREKGIEAENLMTHLGRKERYWAEEGENSFTMAAEASRKVIKNSNLSPEDIDMLVFVSETPEYSVPTNALKLNNLLVTKNAHIVFDMNDNCIGMITAMDVVSRYMRGDGRIKYALVVGALYTKNMLSEDCPISFPNISDGAAAIILENTFDSNVKTGCIDSGYFTNSKNHELMVYPKCGCSNLNNKDFTENDRRLYYLNHDVSFFSDEWKNLVTKLLAKNELKKDDVAHYLFSQFSKPDVMITLEKMEISIEKTTFVGEKYGYTGCSSPFFALHDAVSQGKVKKGDYVVLCSVGAGYTMAAVLLRL